MVSDIFLTTILLGFIIGFSVSCLIEIVCFAYYLRKEAYEELDDEC